MPAWHDGTGPKGPADRGATKAKARGLSLPTSGFSTRRKKRVDHIDTSRQTTRQTGLSPQTSSVRHVYALKSMATRIKSPARDPKVVKSANRTAA